MRFLILLAAVAPFGCSNTPSTAQPEPVPVNRKFFDNTGDPTKQRPLPNKAVK